MESTKCLYKILGVDKSATQEEIKTNYRKLSMQHHPDKNNGNSPIFSEITAAYDILGDIEKRKQYDFSNNDCLNDLFSNMFSGERKAPPNLNNIKNLFSSFPMENIFSFSGGMSPFDIPIPSNLNETLDDMHKHMNKINNSMNKPDALVKNIIISLKQAYYGCSIPINIKRIIKSENLLTEEEEKIYIDIPQGVDDNELIVLENKGNIYNNIHKGDVKIFIKIKNDTPFKREGLDLILCKEITLKEAICGFSFETIFLDDSVFKLSNKNGNIINPSFNKCVNNMGMKRNGNQGQLIIKFNIIFPNSLTDDQIDKLKEILP